MPYTDFSKCKYTLQQALEFTQQSEFASRFDNAKRDKVTTIKVKTVKCYDKRKNKPSIMYVVESSSLPQYKPYASGSKDKRGRKRLRQHSVKHFYDTTFVFGDEGMILSTKQWKSVTGSMRKIPTKIPQEMVAQIHRDTAKRWKKKYSSEKYKQKVRSHKRKAKYLSDGDFIAQVYHINLDFIYRQAYAYYINGHLYGRNYNGNIPAKKTNPNNIVFLNKHQLQVISALLQAGYLKR